MHKKTIRRFRTFTFEGKPLKIWQPLGSAYVAGVLREEGHDVKIFDMEFEDEKDTFEKLKKFDAVAVDSETFEDWLFPLITSYGRAKELIKGLNENDVTTIYFGPQPSLWPEHVLKDAKPDFCVINEADYSVRDLVAALEKDKGVEKVKGIAFMKGRKFVKTEPREYIRDLDELPYPAYDLLPMDKYYDNYFKGEKFSIAISSRGCPFRCIYCFRALFGNKFRGHSAERVVDEIEYLGKKFGIKHLSYIDELMVFDKPRLLKICDLIVKRDLGITWRAQSRASLFDNDMAKAMKRAGCVYMDFGVESCSQTILNNLKKGLTREQIYRAFRICKENDLRAFAYLMVGCPGETHETVKDSLGFALKLPGNPGFRLLTCTPLPNTQLFKMAVDNGVLPPNANWDQCYGATGKVMCQLSNEEVAKYLRIDDLTARFKRNPAKFIKAFVKMPARGKAEFIRKRMQGAVNRFLEEK
jgi:anaerobic magnesium-protoporphyrin IX monomethyl ester cyclase